MSSVALVGVAAAAGEWEALKALADEGRVGAWAGVRVVATARVEVARAKVASREAGERARGQSVA